jgi:HSP20 family protein
MTRRPKKKQEAYQDQNAEQDEQKLPAESEGGEPTRSRPTFRPRVDILETDAGLVLIADMPGATPESVEIMLEHRQLTIRADVEDHAPEGMSALYLEYEVGDWERSFTLSREFDMEKIEAALKDGVLTVTLPKAPEMEAKRIQVSAG